MKQNEANMWDKQMSMAQVFGQMVAGSFVAVAVIGIPIVYILFFYFIGTFLPIESKQADDPTPDSFVHMSDQNFLSSDLAIYGKVGAKLLPIMVQPPAGRQPDQVSIKDTLGMCKKEREDNQGRIERQGFRNRHDSRIFVEPFDLFHVFSGLNFSKLSLDKILNRFEKGEREERDQLHQWIFMVTKKIVALKKS